MEPDKELEVTMNSTLQDFRNRQDEIVVMLGDLKAMLKPEILSIKPNAKTTYELLCSLGRKLKDHLAAEDKGVYPPLLIHEDPKLKSLAWGFISGQKPLRKQFEEYYNKWLKDCNFEFTDAFLEESVELFSAIEYRIEREQTVLIPKLEQSGLFARL
jgi:hypothetical protein